MLQISFYLIKPNRCQDHNYYLEIIEQKPTLWNPPRRFSDVEYGPRLLKSTGRQGHTTCDIGPSDMRQGLKIVVTWDIAFSLIRHLTLGKISGKDKRHCHFLKLTCDIGEPPSRALCMELIPNQYVLRQNSMKKDSMSPRRAPWIRAMKKH